ncbi:hypothetical protein [Brumimicrobium oceani]|uniref:GWxTD domain-containing protein n=1 Tax=Brumimicrobium oceani TaxID=2100725 RepID=A0A2U2XES2_9FLAO|nr:hypothetical protein [Brumimicrobium oceani]PWH86306.1 hypothetical protein DIT68_03445 [Brumimicrobium oceani]
MIKQLFILFVLLQTQSLIAQNRTLCPEEVHELIVSKEFKKIEPIEFNLDSIGVKIIRQFFYDKANYPDQVSKKQYLDRPYMGSWEKRNLASFLKRLKNAEYRKKVYTLTDADSLLLRRQKRGQTGMWSFRPIDTSIAMNPYYAFFSFDITTARNTIPRSMVANGFESTGSYRGSMPVAKQSALIYDSRFTVGIPKVILNSSNNEQFELPLIIIGKDFVSYRAGLSLLENVLKESGYSDNSIRFTLVQLYVATNYYSTNEIESVPCQSFNLFKNKSCYQFKLRKDLEYIFTMKKTHEISYKLKEEAENLKYAVETAVWRSYSDNYPEIEFKSKRGRRFIYEVTYRTSDYQYKKSKAIYNRGRVRFRDLKP